jgi:NADH-quinone oxidoreductase subunit G
VILALAAKIAASGEPAEGWNGLAVLHTAAARVGGLDLGFVPGDGGHDVIGMIAAAAAKEIDVLFLLGADEIPVNALGDTFVVYIGTHGDAGAHRADVILPGAAYTEKSAIYVNTEGRVQMTARAAFPPGEAREDWAILRALSDHLGKRLPYDSLRELRRALYAAHPHFMRVDQIAPAEAGAARTAAMRGGTPSKDPFKPAVADFYLTNPIARASAVMAECSALHAGRLAVAAE